MGPAVAPEGAPGPAGSLSGPAKSRLITAAAAVAGVVVGAVTMGVIDRNDSPTPMELRSGSGFDGDRGNGNMPGFGDGDQGNGNMPGFGDGDGDRGYGNMPGFGDGDQGNGNMPGFGDGNAPNQDVPSQGGQSDGSGSGGFTMPGGGGPHGFSGAS